MGMGLFQFGPDMVVCCFSSEFSQSASWTRMRINLVKIRGGMKYLFLIVPGIANRICHPKRSGMHLPCFMPTQRRQGLTSMKIDW